MTPKFSFRCLILFVQDVDKLKHFYTEKLHLEVLEETNSEWVLLNAGGCDIGLHRIPDQYRGDAPFKVDNNTKVVFEIDRDIVAVRAELLQDNITVGDIKEFEGYAYRLCDGEDPEGNVFQLRQKKN